jgi:hypothetical protein
MACRSDHPLINRKGLALSTTRGGSVDRQAASIDRISM